MSQIRRNQQEDRNALETNHETISRVAKLTLVFCVCGYLGAHTPPILQPTKTSAKTRLGNPICHIQKDFLYNVQSPVSLFGRNPQSEGFV